VEDDLGRRDVSVKAIALRLADGALIAWPGALDDLAAGRLRVLHDASFRDDPTRLLRVARYAARLGFAIDPATDELWAAAVRDRALDTVTGSRLGDELRLLAGEPQPAALHALERHGLGRALLHPAFVVDADLVRRAQDLVSHGERADLAALAATLRGVGRDELAAALDRLAFPAPERDLVVSAATTPALPADGDDGALYLLARRLSSEAVAVAGAAGDAAAARRWLDDLRHRRLSITGDDLVAAGLHGPAVGAALERATVALMRGEARDRPAQLAVALAS
jgi:tRNA nucleotidyltransferase (CCA-adding enzyme)